MHRLPSLALLLSVVVVPGALPPLAAQGTPDAAPASEVATVSGASLPADAFVFRYGREHPALPALAELGTVAVPLVLVDGVYTAPAEGAAAPAPALLLGSVPAGSRFDAAALQRVAEAVVGFFNARDLYGVWVAYERIEVSAAGGLVDTRPTSDTAATMVVWASQVGEVRTLARGTRFPPSAANNHPKHRWILERSPLQPPLAAGAEGSLFRRDLLENYLQGLSAQPGRRVEASLASAAEPGEVILDYLVTETKPWQVYGQISNTGTDATDEWRGRVGFQHNQLTNRDDVFAIDAITTPDFKTYAAFTSYRYPLIRPATLALRVYGSYGDFVADALSDSSLRYVGDNWVGGVELTYRRPLWRGWNLLGNVGTSYSHYGVDQEVGESPITSAEADFLVPYLGAAVERTAEWWSATASLRVEHSIDSIPDDSTNGFTGLGRQGASAEWTSLRFALGGNVYLEPLLKRGRGYQSLAHEVSLRVRGRFLLTGDRLIAQEQDLLGGFFSVRGYPEAAAAADESLIVNAEYLLHIPRLLRPGETGTLFGDPFRWRPPAPLRRTDWDLIFRGFVDYGARWVSPLTSTSGLVITGSKPLSERSLDLCSAGGGLEFVFKQYFSLRCDVGYVLADMKTSEETIAEVGDMKAHVIATFSW